MEYRRPMVSSYFREMRLRTERNDPRCTLFYTYQPAALKLSVKPPVRVTVAGDCGPG